MLALLAIAGWAGGLPHPVASTPRARSVAAASEQVAWLDDRGVWLADRRGRVLGHWRLDADRVGVADGRLVACHGVRGWELARLTEVDCAAVESRLEASGRVDRDHCPDRVVADDTGVWWEPADCGRPTREFAAVIEDGSPVDGRVGETLHLVLVGASGPGNSFRPMDLPDGVALTPDGRMEIRIDEPQTLRIGLHWRDGQYRPHYDLLSVRVRGESSPQRLPRWATMDNPARCVRAAGVSVGHPEPWGLGQYSGSPALAYTCESKGAARIWVGADTAPMYWFSLGSHLLGAHILGFVAGVGVGGDTWTVGPYATAGMLIPPSTGLRAMWMPVRWRGQHWGLELRYGALFEEPSTSETMLLVSWRPDAPPGSG
jgi:hypothetical protein